MFDQDYFALRLFRLKAPEEWASRNEALCFVFPTGGVGQYVKGSITRRLLPGDVMVCDGDPGGKLCVAKGAELVFRSFFLRMEHLLPLFAGSEVSLLREVTGHLKDAKVYSATTALAIKCHRLIEEAPSQFDLEHRSHLLRVAATILNEEFQTTHHQRVGLGQVEGRMIQVFEQLSVDQLLGLSVGELSAKFGCSRRHLNRLFHQYFGFSVGALRMEMRLLKAVSLLRDEDAKVINVAAQCGFNHLGLFNTCFKRRFGVSPGRWRKQDLAGNVQPVALPAENSPCPLQGKGLCPMAAGSPGGTSPLIPKVSSGVKSAGAGTLPGTLRHTIASTMPVSYPTASTSMPLRA